MQKAEGPCSSKADLSQVIFSVDLTSGEDCNLLSRLYGQWLFSLLGCDARSNQPAVCIAQISLRTRSGVRDVSRYERQLIFWCIQTPSPLLAKRTSTIHDFQSNSKTFSYVCRNRQTTTTQQLSTVTRILGLHTDHKTMSRLPSGCMYLRTPYLGASILLLSEDGTMKRVMW